MFIVLPIATFSIVNADAELISKGSSPADGSKISFPSLKSSSSFFRFVLLIILYTLFIVFLQ